MQKSKKLLPWSLRSSPMPGTSLFKPLLPIVIFYLMGILIFLTFRAALVVKYYERVREVENYLLLFPMGFRVDTTLLCYVLLPPFIMLCILPLKVIRRIYTFFSLYFTILTLAFIFLECATFPYLAEFDSRPDRIFFENIVQVREVFSMVWKGYPLPVTISLMALFSSGWIVFSYFQKLLRNYQKWSPSQGMVYIPIMMLFFYFGIRSSFIHGNAAITTAAFSRNHLVNELALNSTHSLAYAYYTMKTFEVDPRKLYGSLDPSEILRRVRKYALLTEENCTHPDIPLLHPQSSHFSRQRPCNLVIIMEESLGAEYVGCLGGLPLTPHLDKLSKQGLLFTNLYCTGTRTDRGIEATISGFLPTPGKSTVKLELSERNFFTIAELLRRRGYITEFIYGGRSRYDNMRAFFLGNGFQQIYDKSDCVNPMFSGIWGISDEDLFNRAREIFMSHGDSPFFALILSVSNHDPFEFPDNRIELYEHPKNTRHNAVKYADYALGKFFESAQQEAYYNNTIFLIIADHGTRLQGEDLIPLHKFHIPGLVIGPEITPGRYEKVASQIDMVPTLLDLMGITTEHPLIGRALLTLPDPFPGRAIMQYGDTHAFMIDHQTIIQRPHSLPLQFIYHHGRLLPTSLNPELAKDALAHALLPAYLYYNRLHRLEQ